MHKLLTCFCLMIFTVVITAQPPYRLAPPTVKYSSVFFKDSAMLSFDFRQAGSVIRYTTDGSEPGETAALYTHPLSFSQNGIEIRAKSFAPGYLPSSSVRIQFFGKGIPIEAIRATAANERYPGRGSSSLADNISGTTDHNSDAWLGYDADSVVLDVLLERNAPVKEVMLHVLENQGAWIFLPEQVKVFEVGGNATRLLSQKIMPVTVSSIAATLPITVSLPHSDQRHIRIVVYPLQQLPVWHQGSGKRAWFFIDELKLY